MAYVVIAVCFGLAGGIVGKVKGSSFFLWFLISGVVPFFGLLAAIAYRFERDELRRRCPNCGRVTKIYDALCTRCGAEPDFPDNCDPFAGHLFKICLDEPFFQYYRPTEHFHPARPEVCPGLGRQNCQCLGSRRLHPTKSQC